MRAFAEAVAATAPLPEIHVEQESDPDAAEPESEPLVAASQAEAVEAAE
jgi:hypothetical protein